MDLESEYIELGLQLALTVVATSLLLLIDFSRPVTYTYSLGIPVLFGYTSMISEEEFKKASFGAAIGLVFIPIGLFAAVTSVFVLACNVFVSFFASGTSFKDHYSATAIPLLLLGVLIGGSAAGYAYYDPGFEEELENKTVEYGAEKTLAMIELAGMDEGADQGAIEDVTNSTIFATQNYVINNYSGRTNNADMVALRNSFEAAREELPEQVAEQATGSESEKIKERTETMIQNTISGRVPAAVFIFSVMTLYALQPVLGILTALSATIFVGLRDFL